MGLGADEKDISYLSKHWSIDTSGTTARCKIPVLSSRGEAVEASDGG